MLDRKECPSCGSMDLYDLMQWDIVIGYECGNCGESWEIGRVGGTPGDHYFIPYKNDPEYTREDLEEDMEIPDIKASSEELEEEFTKIMESISGYEDVPF